LNIASCTAHFISPRLGVYSALKKALDVYSQILTKEAKGKIDVISVRPFGVATNMMQMKKSDFIIKPVECVMGSLVDLVAGHPTTFSHFKHKLQAISYRNMS